ncbi:MAG: hypothetical protein Ct9H300mP1_32770 [Planctomycetaceae bacterium]|nr:MAG: hypothetical protein Ct9H300mP1_32770 [Planctomycetaceae bacterium]
MARSRRKPPCAQGQEGQLPGIKVSELSKDQQQLVLATSRPSTPTEGRLQEAMKVLEAGGGLKTLNMAFYTAADLGKNKVGTCGGWRADVGLLFRGAPHVHAYINVGLKNV